MCRISSRTALLATILAVTTCFAASVVHAGPFDKIKKKIEKKVEEKEQKVDDKTDKATEAKEGAEESGEAKPSSGGSTSGSGDKVSAVSTKFDYVPGDSVILLDDFTQDELGEFPARWRLSNGTFEVAEMEGERWLRCASDDGHVRMKVPPSLPEFWTLEFDAYGLDTGSYLQVYGLTSGGSTVWETMYPHSGKNMMFRCGEVFSTTALQGTPVVGRHHVAFMVRGTGLKVYMDRERLASVPDITAPGIPTEIDFRLWAPNMKVRPMITNVRFAEGCRPAKDMLAEGKLVTYGIHFETGSDVVQPDSAPILRQIAAYLESKPDVKLKITGHTDNVGSAASNLDLSQRRAASVARVLSSDFKVAADRFKTDGKGDTQSVASNAKPEGRAMNRRVEFIKL
jgi:outer membrane protein OmpA-like peptidoglycan-associated protein